MCVLHWVYTGYTLYTTGNENLPMKTYQRNLPTKTCQRGLSNEDFPHMTIYASTVAPLHMEAPNDVCSGMCHSVMVCSWWHIVDLELPSLTQNSPIADLNP